MMNDRRRGYAYRYDQETLVLAHIDDAFAFLADPRSVSLRAPARMGVRFVAGPPRDLGLGSEREYIFRWSGIPVYVRLRVTEFEPPDRLALRQVLGPWQSYGRSFTLRRVPGGTSIAEHVDFRAMPGVLDHIVHRLVAARSLAEAAAVGRTALLRHLGGYAPASEAVHG
jgi:hypothetical protein